MIEQTQAASSNADETPVQSITAGYDSWIVARRWLGAWIDFVVVACFLLIPDSVLGNRTYRSTLVVWLTLFAAYFPVMEVLFGGTVGKFVSGTRVVNGAGGKPSLGQAVVRTLFRLIEVNPFLAGGVPAGIAAAASRHHQRLGDMVAHTYVLLSKDLRRISTPGVG